MLNQRKIKSYLENNIPKGIPIHVKQILDMIKNKFVLTNYDWAPHTKTRPTKYPRWAHRVQGTLSYLKGKGLVVHDRINNTYTF